MKLSIEGAVIIGALLLGIVLVGGAALVGHSIWTALAAIGTIVAVVWAIFHQGILNWFNRPKLHMNFFESEFPHLRQVPLSDPITGKQIATGYPLSIELRNTGKRLAKNTQPHLTGMGRAIGGSWETQDNWISAPVRWALDVPAEISGDKPTEERDLVPHRPYVFNFGILRTDYPQVFFLNTLIMPGNQDREYKPGEFAFELKVFAEEIEPVERYFHIKWDGGCTDDFEDVKKKIKIWLKDRPPWQTSNS